MSCMLRISGDNFDVGSFLERSEWKGDIANLVKAYRKGEYINTLKQRTHFDSGLGIQVSDAPFDSFERQQEDAIAFLKQYRSTFLLLREYKADNWHCLDFGLDAEAANGFSKTHILSHELISLCSEYGLEIHMSNYHANSEE